MRIPTSALTAALALLPLSASAQQLQPLPRDPNAPPPMQLPPPRASASADAPSQIPLAPPTHPPLARAKGPNHPPIISVQRSMELHVGEPHEISVNASDPDGDALTLTVENLPRGARVTNLGTRLDIHWEPRDEDIGEHEITITASDGEAASAAPLTLAVVEEWKTFFMPGLQYSGYGPSAQSHWGSFHGVSAEFLLFAWIARNNNRGPSHGRLYVDLDVLWSTHTGVSSAFSPTMGIDLSIERNPFRRILLPYFGLESGGIFQKDFGSLGIITPFLGVHLFASQNIFVNVTAGYVLPLDANGFDDFRGWRLKVGVDFSLW